MTRTGPMLRFAVAIGVVLAPFHGVRAQATGRIAFVNVPAILQSMPDYRRADSIYKGYAAQYQVQETKLQSILDSAGQAYQDTQAMLTQSDRANKLKQLQRLQDSLNAADDSLKSKSQQQQQELLQPIIDRVRSVVEGIRAENNYDYIIDINAMGSAVLAVNKSLDMTQKAIDRLQSAPGGAGHE
jgi:outer membrane protein